MSLQHRLFLLVFGVVAPSEPGSEEQALDKLAAFGVAAATLLAPGQAGCVLRVDPPVQGEDDDEKGECCGNLQV